MYALDRAAAARALEVRQQEAELDTCGLPSSSRAVAPPADLPTELPYFVSESQLEPEKVPAPAEDLKAAAAALPAKPQALGESRNQSQSQEDFAWKWSVVALSRFFLMLMMAQNSGGCFSERGHILPSAMLA